MGLHWLHEGENRFGSAPDNDMVFPEGRAPDHVGSFVVEQDRVTVRAAAGSGLMLDGEPVVERVVRADDSGSPDILGVGELSFYLLRRNDRYALRVKDPASPILAAFTGMEYFPIDPAYRISAEFVAYDEPRPIEVPNVLGYSESMSAPGEVVFRLGGESLTLVPVLSSPEAEQLFFIFSDGTSGKETYGAGRFLYTPLPEGGRVDLDFNKADSPPCVFTPYATCPLPPHGNRLSVRIEAGEKDFAHEK